MARRHDGEGDKGYVKGKMENDERHGKERFRQHLEGPRDDNPGEQKGWGYQG